MVNKVTKEILEFLVLWWIYFTLMQPVSYAFGASVMVTIVTSAAGPQPLSPPSSDH
ncbi:membrane protein [Cutibacterium acnes HL201PA1]|nr:membrane protein [Cutibacterium acnes HL201PA1]